MDNAAEFNETWLVQAFHINQTTMNAYDNCNHVFNGGDWYDWLIRQDAAAPP